MREEDRIPAYWAVIPASVRYNENLSNGAKLLYGEISALCNREGYCWANNMYFSKLYKKETRTIQRWLEQLEGEGFIAAEYDKFDEIKLRRKIWIIDMDRPIVRFGRGEDDDE